MARRKAERFPSWATVMEYVDSILKGRKIACPELVQACRRFKQDLENPAWDFNPRDAEFVIRIIETTFVHQQGERLDGTPLRGSRSCWSHSTSSSCTTCWAFSWRGPRSGGTRRP